MEITYRSRRVGAINQSAKEKPAMRATFVLDRDRKVVFSVACPVNVGRSVSETLRIVRAIRTGRLCPAEWKPGDAFGPSDLRY